MEHKERSVTFNYNTHCNFGRGVGWWKGLVGGGGDTAGRARAAGLRGGRGSREREREREREGRQAARGGLQRSVRGVSGCWDGVVTNAKAGPRCAQ